MPRAASLKSTEVMADATPEIAQQEGADLRDEALAQFKEFRVRPVSQRMGPLDDFLRVQNLPADRCVTWATDPRIDNGRHLAFVKGLGFRPVEVDEVTTNPAVTTKLVVNQFEEGPHRMVAIGGGVLMIGYRQYRDERRQRQREEMATRIDSKIGSLDDMGIEQRGVSKRADLTEVTR